MTLETMEPDEDVMFEGQLDAAPEKVWRALTMPELLSAWLLPASAGAGTLHLDGTPEGQPSVECAVIEADEPSLLRYRWRADGEAESVVTFELTRIEGGTWLRLTHAALRPPALVAANSNVLMALAA